MVFNKAECTATGGGAFKQFTLSPLEEAVSNLLQFEKQINPEGVFLGAPNPDIEEEDPANSNRQKSTISATAPSTTITILSATASAETTPSATSAETTSSAINSAETTLSATTSAETTPSATSAETTSSAINSAETTLSATTSAKTTPSTIKKVLKRKFSPTQKKTEVVDRHKLLEAHSKDQARLLTDISNSMSSMKRTLKDLKDIQQKRLKLEVERSGREKELHENVIKIKKIEFLIKERKLQALNAQTLNYN